MSRRKQTNPNKVHWDRVFAGLEEQARQAMMKTDFPGDLGSQRQAVQQLRDQDSSSSDSEGDEEETTQDEVSSHTSEGDGGVVKVEKLDRGSRRQLIAHVYQHTAAVVSAKSYMCPVCGRALSSPGSLGRHLLIHSEDQQSNSHSEGPSSAEGKGNAFSPPVYPAGILLVCNNCAAYRRLLEAQTPSVRKWGPASTERASLEVRLQRLERERTAKKSRRDNETPEEREVRRMRD
ncbi:zinc finger domain-containing protein, partial [Eschrichtius robustus]|nr:zinc finger domain-containing protein [Eschrichtius robustus]